MGQLCGRLFPDAAGAVLVTPASRDGLWAVAVWGPPLAGGRERFQLDDCWALRRGRVYRVDDARTSPACLHLGEPAPPAFVCVPLAAQGETLGLFTLAVPPGAAAEGGLGEARVRLAVTVAEQFALALANVRLRETLRSQSIRDPLTGLFNRRYMEETLDRELSRAEREHRPLSLLLLDIDRFKHFNDSFGHEAGDIVLSSLGALLRSVSRAGDVACRYGGEEFVLILPAASLADAQRRAEEIREAIREAPGDPRGPAARGGAVLDGRGRVPGARRGERRAPPGRRHRVTAQNARAATRSSSPTDGPAWRPAA